MKKAVVAAVLLGSVLLASGCTAQQEETVSSEVSSEAEVVSSSASSETTEAVTVNEATINHLTGINDLSEEAVGKRPIAVMVNNITASLPQYGISSADLLFEVVVEGGITRLMAVYGDYTKVPDVCSIRSCRYYYPILAQGLDAVYIHCGYDKTIAYDTLLSLGIDRFDGNEGNSLLFERDAQRQQTYALEHTMKLKGGNIPSAMESANMRSDLLESKNTAIFSFYEEGKIVQPDGGSSPCEKMTLWFSPSSSTPYYSTFTYDAASKTYLKQHNGNAHMDSATGEQLSYTNVFALETSFSVRDEKGRMNVDWTGGTGYYFSGGAYQRIYWSKPTEDSNITITDENGTEIKVNAGKSYFGILETGNVEIG